MGNFKIEDDSVKQMAEIKKWLQGNFFKQEIKKEDEPLGCLPLEEVEDLLRKCAWELGIEYKEK